jgi:ADP-ribose pyrophosphatase YjhB (NUDIX family)
VTLNLRAAVRALIVDDSEHTLLVKFVFPSGIVAWALPGGGLEHGETPEDGLRRELHEELGLTDVEIGPHIWSREHVVPMHSGHDGQRDRIHLVRITRFDPAPAIGWERLNAEFVHEMRWWSLDDIVQATDVRFAPRRLADHFARFLTDGPPVTPFDTGI